MLLSASKGGNVLDCYSSFFVLGLFSLLVMSVRRREKSMAFLLVMAGLPVRFSMSRRAFPATSPPLLATCRFSSKVCGFCSLDNSVVVTSAS